MRPPKQIKYRGQHYVRADKLGGRTFAVKGKAIYQYQDGQQVHGFAYFFLNDADVLRAMAEWLDNKDHNGQPVSFGHVQQAVANSHVHS